MAKPKLDAKTFLSDPKNEDQKNFLFGVIDSAIDERVKREQSKKATSNDESDINIFDFLFGGKSEDKAEDE